MNIVDLYNQYDDYVTQWLEEIEIAQRSGFSGTLIKSNDPVLNCYKQIRDELKQHRDEFLRRKPGTYNEARYEVKMDQLRQEKNEFDQYRNACILEMKNKENELKSIWEKKIYDVRYENKINEMKLYEAQNNLKKMIRDYKYTRCKEAKICIVEKFIKKYNF